jgi:protein-disulfide isomerase
LENYIKDGNVRYIFRNFPLHSIHPQAQLAAEAAECAGEQGKYWEMHDLIFEGQEQWSGSQNADEILEEMAGSLDLDGEQFSTCLAEGKYTDRVNSDLQEGIAEGVTGTPAFRINGSALSGAQPFAAFQQQIEFYLAGGEPPSLEVDADSFRSIGSADAPVVITEFSDYQCPACSAVAREVIPELIEQYVETGRVRFVYREYPLTSIHPTADKASEAAVCAGQQDMFWAMNEQLFATSSEWSQSSDPTPEFKTYAEELGLDTEAFTECLDSGEAAIVIQGDLMAGETLGVNATPFFFVNDLPIRGGLPVESLGRIIDYVAAGGPPPEILPTAGDWHVRGDPQTATAITVAFVDYASPQSGEHAREILPQLADQYIDSGQMLYVLHPWTEEADSPGAMAAVAAECAGEQDQGWEMHARIFDEQASWTGADEPGTLFTGYAESLGLDADEFQACLESEEAQLRAMAGSVVGALYNVPGAPVFLFNNGQGQEGSPSLEEFQAVIDSILNP